MSDFRFQPWPGTIAITTLLEFCSWLNLNSHEQNSDLLMRLYNKQRHPACLKPIYCDSALQNSRFAQP